MSRPMNNDPMYPSTEDAAVLEAGQRVIDRAKRTGTPIVVWKDGQVVEIASDDLSPNIGLQMLADEHREWLSAFDSSFGKQWEDRLRDDLRRNQEGALTEAGVRRLLQYHGISVEPNEGANGGPDFLCLVNSKRFYVEVTCISVERATQETGISTEPQGPSHYRILNDAVFEAVRKKTPQCAKVNDAPVLLAVGTFHGYAAMACFAKPKMSLLLTGGTGFAWRINPNGSGAVGDPYLYTELRNSPFLKPDPARGVGFARVPISGLLLCSVGFAPPKAIGILHPNPVRAFDPRLLSGIEFGTVEVQRDDGRLIVHWPTEND